jgi:hypothetical protein
MAQTTRPKRPVGFTPEALYMQWVYDSIVRLQPKNSPTVTVDSDSKGLTFHAAGGGPGGTPLQLCAVTQLYNADYIGVTPWDVTGLTTNGAQFFCAKSVTSRMPAVETIDTIVITYDEYQDNQRRATFNYESQGNTIEFHSCHPRYLTFPEPMGVTLDPDQYLILIAKSRNGTGVTDPDGNQIYYAEIQPCRYWAWNPGLNGQ